MCDLSLLNLIYKLIYLILIYIESIPALLYIYGAINVMFYSILGILNGYKVKKKKNRMILKCWGFFFFKFNIYAQYDFKNDHDKKKKKLSEGRYNFAWIFYTLYENKVTRNLNYRFIISYLINTAWWE